MNQSKFLVISRNLRKARKKSRAQGATGFGLAPHWLEIGAWFLLKPITIALVSFDRHLKTALTAVPAWPQHGVHSQVIKRRVTTKSRPTGLNFSEQTETGVSLHEIYTNRGL